MLTVTPGGGQHGACRPANSGTELGTGCHRSGSLGTTVFQHETEPPGAAVGRTPAAPTSQPLLCTLPRPPEGWGTAPITQGDGTPFPLVRLLWWKGFYRCTYGPSAVEAEPGRTLPLACKKQAASPPTAGAGFCSGRPEPARGESGPGPRLAVTSISAPQDLSRDPGSPAWTTALELRVYRTERRTSSQTPD